MHLGSAAASIVSSLVAAVIDLARRQRIAEQLVSFPSDPATVILI